MDPVAAPDTPATDAPWLALLAEVEPRHLQAFFVQHHRSMPDREFWPFLRAVWTLAKPALSEDRAATAADWRAWFTCGRGERDGLMTDGGRARLAALPSVVPIFRGVHPGSDPAGLSWSLDPEPAEWFATAGPGGGGYVMCATVARGAILALWDDMGLVEVVVFPGDVQNREARPVTATDAPTCVRERGVVQLRQAVQARYVENLARDAAIRSGRRPARRSL